MATTKSLEWLTSLMQRFEDQLPVKVGPLSDRQRHLIEHTQKTLVNVSKTKFPMVISGLVLSIQNVNAMRSCSPMDLFESQCIILETIEQCLDSPSIASSSRLEESAKVKLILNEMSTFFQLQSDNHQTLCLKERASRVVRRLSQMYPMAVMSRLNARIRSFGAQESVRHGGVSEGTAPVDGGVDFELAQHVHIDKQSLTDLLKDVCQYRPLRKDGDVIGIVGTLERVIWNWIEGYPNQFADLKQLPEDPLTAASDALFEYLDQFNEASKRRHVTWPLQMLLLFLSPQSLEDIQHTAPSSQSHPTSAINSKKKTFFGVVRKLLSSGLPSRGLPVSINQWASHAVTTSTPKHKDTYALQPLVAASIAGVSLVRAATYLNPSGCYANVAIFSMVRGVIGDLKTLLLNPAKPLLRLTMGGCELEVMIDLFVALFRLQYVNEAFKICLSSPCANLQLVLVMALYRIAIQPRLAWWPRIDLLYSRSQDMRNLFSETLTKFTQPSQSAYPSGALTSSNHMTLGVTKSLQKVTGRLRDRTTTAATLDDTCIQRQLLFWITRLICRQPILFLQERVSVIPIIVDRPPQNRTGRLVSGAADVDQDLHNTSTWELINGLVSLLAYSNQMHDISLEAMNALLCLHQVDNIRFWNPESPLTTMQTFWCIGSQLLYSVCLKLLHHQLPNYPSVLRWLRQLLNYRNVYLMNNREIANFGSTEQICKQAAAKLEMVCFIYLWSLDSDAVLAALSLFRCICDEAEIRCALDDMPPDYNVYSELANATNLQTAGRAALQKSICHHLRRFKTRTEACERAWEDTSRYWERFTDYLEAYPRSKSDERLLEVEQLCRVLTEPRNLSLNSSNQVQFDTVVCIWANMTGFLCSMGAVCDHASAAENMPMRRPSQFICRLLSLLNQGDAIEPQIIRHVKEILSQELNPIVYPLLFEQIKNYTDMLFDASGYVILSQVSSEFLEHVVYVMRNIMQSDPTKIGHSKWSFSTISIEPILVSICRYARFMEATAHNLAVRSKICYLIEIVMERRAHLLFRSEIKFRNRLLDYFTDWLLMSHPSSAISTCSLELVQAYRELDMACIKATNAVLVSLPLQPDQTEHDVVEAKSRLFQRNLHTFMTLLNDCVMPASGRGSCCHLGAAVANNRDRDRDTTTLSAQNSIGGIEGELSSAGWHSDNELSTRTPDMNASRNTDYEVVMIGSQHHHNSSKCRAATEQQVKKVRRLTVQAMANMLAANIDVGLVHALSLGYHRDLHMRGAFIEVLTRILQEGMEFSTLNETAMADRYQQLIKLVTMITDDGDLPIALALASVVHAQQLDELARVLVTVFDARRLLYELNWKIFSKEVEAADAPTTLFRGNTLASKLMGYCFRLYGSVYLRSVLQPIIRTVINEPNKCYEVEPSRLENDANLDENISNVLTLVEKTFDAVVKSHENFPVQLRSMCRCLHQVVNWRFPNCGLNAVEMIVFLRFVNPALVSPFEYGLAESAPTPKMRRGLMISSKILQAIANKATFIKEPCLVPFNVFIQSRMEHARNFISLITLGCSSAVGNASSQALNLQKPSDLPSTSIASSEVHPSANKPNSAVVANSERMSRLDLQAGSTAVDTFVSETQLAALHNLLWSCQDDVSRYFASSPAYAQLNRRLLTLLAQIGPPPNRPSYEGTSAETVTIGNDFESMMNAKNMSNRDEFRQVQELNVFFMAGHSRLSHPVFYYIVRRYKALEVDDNALLYHILVLLKNKTERHFDLVIDCTHADNENRFKPDTLQRLLTSIPEPIVNSLNMCYIINCNSFVRKYVAQYQRLLTCLKGNRKIVVLENLCKLNDYVEHEQQRLPTSTISLNQEIHLFNNAVRVANKEYRCTVKVSQLGLQITYAEKSKLMAIAATITDVFYASEMQDLCQVDDNTIQIVMRDGASPLTLSHRDGERLKRALHQLVSRHEFTQSQQRSGQQHSKIRAKDVPGTLLNIALLNLGSVDPTLRSLAYNFLCALNVTFDFSIDDKLLAAEGLLIPSNNTGFITEISERISFNKPHLTLEFLEQCVQSFEQPVTERHVSLEYMSPWLCNLPKFMKQGDEGKRDKIIQMMDALISLTIEEPDIYPLVQRLVWRRIGRQTDLLDMALDALIKRTVDNGGLTSSTSDVVAETAVALAADNKSLITASIVSRFITVLEKTCSSPRLHLTDHPLWNDIAVLARIILVLSFNNCLDVPSHLPSLLHFVSVLLCVGPLSLRASMHGITVNLIHSLAVCTQPSFTDETRRLLRLALTELSMSKFYALFGIAQVNSRTVASAALRPMVKQTSNNRPLAPKHREQSTSVGSMMTLAGCSLFTNNTNIHTSYYQALAASTSRTDVEEQTFQLSDLKVIIDTLKEVLQGVQKDMGNRDLIGEWAKLARCFAFRYNQALQPRALVTFACLTRKADEQDVKQILTILVQAIKRREEPTLMSALLMALTSLHATLPPTCPIHYVLFWVAVIMFQLEDTMLYEQAICLLDSCLRTLDAHNAFNYESMEKLMMDIRRPLEWEFKALDQQVGLSFRHYFHFALVGYLLKGLRHPSHTIRQQTVRLFHLLLNINAKTTRRNRYDVTADNLPYLLALLPYAEDVRRRCHLRSTNLNNHLDFAVSDSTDTLNVNVAGGADVFGDLMTSSAGDGSVFEPSDTIERLRRIESQLAANQHQLHSSIPETFNPAPSSTTLRGVQVPRYVDRLECWSQQQSGSCSSSQALARSTTVQLDDTVLAACPRTEKRTASRSKSMPISPIDVIAPILDEMVPIDDVAMNAVQLEQSAVIQGAGRPSTEYSSVMTSSGGSTMNADVRDDDRLVARASLTDSASNVLLDETLLARLDHQALVITLLATLIRISTEDHEQRVLFQYLAEASDLWPKVFTVVQPLLDSRITQLLLVCHDTALLSHVLHIVHNMLPTPQTAVGVDNAESVATAGQPAASQADVQHVTALHAIGFAGLWRFAGPFLNKASSQQAMTAEVCACLERLVGILGELPPMTPPPRLPPSPVFLNFPVNLPKPADS